ncbi:MAG TPA: VOC family protein, partial [Burkholderiales bacterium]|nr:VOC family protein [Burkholderiales bacterium]
MQDAAHLAAYRRRLKQTEEFSSPFFADGAFATVDPDARRVVFGVSQQHESEPAGLQGRLQHFVCATQRLPEMLEFYRGLGMVESDRVLEADALSAVFLRSDPEHHSFAAFRAPESRPDHHCYETPGWLDIR